MSEEVKVEHEQDSCGIMDGREETPQQCGNVSPNSPVSSGSFQAPRDRQARDVMRANQSEDWLSLTHEKQVHPAVESQAPPAGIKSDSDGPQKPPYADCLCLRCGWTWHAKSPHKRPSSCARCGSHLWDTPPQRAYARRPTDAPNPRWALRAKREASICPTCKRKWKPKTVAQVEYEQGIREREAEAEAAEAEAERVAREEPARPKAIIGRVTAGHTGVGMGLTPPPGLRSPLPPPPHAGPRSRHQSAPEPEQFASRPTQGDELESKPKGETHD